MKEVTSMEICNETEISFLRTGDFEYEIKDVESFMHRLEKFPVMDEQEKELLKHVGLEGYDKELGFHHVLNLLDRMDIKVLQEYSTLIN